MEETEKRQAEADPTQGDMGIEEAEKLITEIGIESTEIAFDTNALRKALIAISEEVGVWAKRAGIKYGDEEKDRWWTFPPDPPDMFTGRLAIKKDSDGKWGIQVENTNAVPEYWDGSNFVGWSNPFDEEAFAQGMAHSGTLEQASRFVLENAGKNVFGYLKDYCEELKRRHLRYSDLRQKMEKIEEVFSSSNIEEESE